MGRGVAGFERNGAAITGDGFGVTIEVVQRNSAVAMRIGETGFDGDRAVVGGNSLGEAAHIVEDHAAVGMRLGVIGLDRSRFFELRQGFTVVFQPVQHEAEVAQGNGGADGERAFEECGGFCRLAVDQQDAAQQLQGFGMFGHSLDDVFKLSARRFGFALLQHCQTVAYCGLEICCCGPRLARVRDGVRDGGIAGGQGGAHALDDFRPVPGSALAEQADVVIPQRVVAVGLPVPEMSGGMGQHQQDWFAQRAGEMRRGVADGDDDVAGVDQRSQSVEVVLVVDGVQMRDIRATALMQRGAFRRGVAVLQVDKTQPRRFQQRAQRGQRHAFQRAVFLVGAAPGQADDAFARRGDGFSQRSAVFGICRQERPAVTEKIICAVAQQRAETAQRNLLLIAAPFHSLRESDDFEAGK